MNSISEKATDILIGAGAVALTVLTGLVCKRGFSKSIFLKAGKVKIFLNTKKQ